MTLHIASRGSGPDLALLHGWGMNAAVWNELTAMLEKNFRVHCVDLPGHGASSTCKPYTLDALSDRLAAALPQCVMVCGWSFGGQVALNWARRKPEQVERLVLIATTPRFICGAGWEYGVAASMLDDMVRNLAADCHATLRNFLTLQAHGDDYAHAVLRQLREWIPNPGAPDVAALEAGLRILKETDLRDSLPRTEQPVLLLHGKCDTIVPLAAGAYLQRALPRAVIEVFAGASHVPFIAQPRRAARHITEFCGGQ